MSEENMMRIVVLSGAGISAESGLRTFRDSNGLWEGEDIEAVASIQGWISNPARVIEFYNKRAEEIAEAQPNVAHIALADLQKHAHVEVITQNIDDLHERAGSKHVLHLHGLITQACSTRAPSRALPRRGPFRLDERAKDGGHLRPFVVWFGEEVTLLPEAAQRVAVAEVCLIIGTSLQVYPAAGLSNYLQNGTPLYLISKELPSKLSYTQGPLHLYEDVATKGLKEAIQHLKEHYIRPYRRGKRIATMNT